jgi:hypothetical protein
MASGRCGQAVAPAFANGTRNAAGPAVALGRILLAFGGLQRFTQGMWELVRATIA